VALAGTTYKTAIERPYRWRDWAAKKDGITGKELIDFINNDEAVRPDGKRGPGLFAYLRSLQGTNGDGRRDVIANVFGGVINRMISGYLLRDVINLIDGIHFDSAEEIHTLSIFYESMIREMRDAAGDSGEFYTPRPVVRFMVEAIDPRLGETLLDPACGTCGFLVESYRHLEKQCKTVKDMQVLQERTIFGGEAKPLPFMLAQMNLLLHGLKSPRITYGNSLAVKLTEIGNKDRVNVVLEFDDRPDLSVEEADAAIRLAGLRVAGFLADLTRGQTPAATETFALGPVDPALPRVAYIYQIQSDGVLRHTFLYGRDLYRMVPTLVHPNELLDGALVNSAFSPQLMWGERSTAKKYRFTLKVWPRAQRMRWRTSCLIRETHSLGAWMYGV
jgi:hypothetical protein